MVQRVVKGGEKDKETLVRVGLSALMAYGLISHITYSSCVIVSWVVHGTRTGLSPLVVGQVSVRLVASLSLIIQGTLEKDVLRVFSFSKGGGKGRAELLMFSPHLPVSCEP